VPAVLRVLGPIAILSLAACGPPAASRTSAPPTGPRTGVNPPASTPLAQPPAEPSGSGLRATIKTSLGDIEIELFDRSAPVATENFVNLARAGFYDGVVFHRLVPGFVIQGGDPEGTGRGGPGYTIRDEPVVGEYARGIVAMARTPQPDSQGSQFFIVLDNEARLSLDQARTYVIFGRVTAGMEVVDRVAAMPNSGEPDNRALQPLAMDRVTISGP
jgi:cyclophilin family peptidyl-prolyl cis-trans isomerase